MEVQWILQETEFLILAAAMGIENIYGIRPQQEPGESEVMYAVHEMTGKGILLFENGVFFVREPYRSAFLTINTAKRILAVTGSSPDMVDTCFYFGRQMITLEKSRWDEHAVRIGMVKKKELYGQLCDRGFLPEPFWETDIAGMQEVEKLADEEAQLYASYLIFDPERENREPCKEFQLLRSSGNDWVSEGESGLVCYDRNAFYEQLTEVLGW